jgi:O-antigen/teichoic acid export membrane protein
MTLKQQTVKGLSWTFLEIFANQGLTFVVSIFLARLLTPEEFGIVGMAMVFISIFQVFSDFGFASALVQNKVNTSLTYSSIFYINIVAGFALFAIFFVSAPLVGNFYDNPEVTEILKWLSLNFVFTAFNQVQQTILKKNIDFKRLTIRTVVARVISGVVAVVLAFMGWGVYALVVQTLLGSAVKTLILWKVSDWYPKWEFSWNEVKKLTSFSMFEFFNQILGQVTRRIDILFIGKVFSPTTLGFYSRAATFNQLFVQYSSGTVGKVFFPVLSSIQDDEKKYLDVYYKAISTISFLTFFVTGLLIIWGETIIMTLFGPQWGQSVLIFQILSLRLFSYPVNNVIINAYLGKGKARENFLVGIIRKVIRLAPFAIGYFYGLYPILYAMVVSSFINTFINILYAKKHLDIPIIPQIRRLFEGFVILIVSVPAFYLFTFSEINIVNEIIFTLIFIPLYFGWNYLIKNEGIFYIIKQYPSIKKSIIKRIK